MQFRSIRILLVLLLSVFTAKAQELITTAYYPLTAIGTGSEMAVSDPLYAGELPATDYKVERRFRVELLYNRNNQTDLASGTKWTLSVVVNNPATGQNETLLLENTPNPANTAKYGAWADFTPATPATNMTWKITSMTVQKWNGTAWIAGTISDIPVQDIHFEAMVFNDRIVNLSSTAAKLSLTNTNILNWDYVPGAVEYDVEWVFIHEYDNFTYNASVPNGPFDFKEPVRITTFKHRQKLDLLYPKGTVYFRVRPKGYQFRTGSKEIYYAGSWSYAKKSGSGNMSLAISTDFEAQKNWQYTVAYAENGMAMSSVTYYDGTLRARQQLSQMNSTGQVVAAGTLYDYEGRQAVQVIPTPINTNSLTYYSQLHRDGSGTAFGKEDFDEGTANPMGTGAGAGRYYSTANDLTSDPFRDRVPNAEGYPYTQTTFINDNTGRPRSSSGVGYAHRMGGGHETQYFYVKPTERDLRELFGSNVGNVSHYDKQVILDPNGQASVSYTDQLGRVIAAGLAGAPPTNLVALDNNPSGAGTTVTASLMPGNLVTTDANGNLQSVTDFYHLNLGSNTITLTYDMLSGGINSVDALFGTTGCASCFYELEIAVFSPLGNPVNIGYTSQTIPGTWSTIRERYSAASLNCASGTFDPTLTPISQVVSLTHSGEYRIRKTLRVDQQAVAAYIAANAATLPGAPNLAAITSGYLSNIVTSGCGFDCAAFYEQECREELGYPVTGTLTTAQRSATDDCIADKCDASLSDIENTTEPEADKCAMILGMLQQDVSPGGWVYEEDLLWRTTTTNWDRSYTRSDNTLFDPVSFDDLTNNWESAWGATLVATHPEHCQYEKCTTLAVVNDYVVALNHVNTWDDAVNGNYIDGSGDFLPANDPLDTHPLYTSTFASPFISDLNANYSQTGNNILAAVNNLISANPNLIDDGTGTSTALTGTALDNRKWMLMRSLYLGEREEYIEDGYTGCAYYNHPDANFTDPDELSATDPGDMPAFDNPPNGDCAGICNNNVAYWMDRITEECGTLSATQVQAIQGYLQNYCLTDCDGIANISGAIQVSDLIASNSDLVAVGNILLSASCTFSLNSLAVDDTCATPQSVTITDVTLFPTQLNQRLAVLQTIAEPDANHAAFITLPPVSAYATNFTLSHWQSTMQVKLTNTVTPASTIYTVADIDDISIVSQAITGSNIVFTLHVRLLNGTDYFHTVNQFSLLQKNTTWLDLPIATVDIKQTVQRNLCEEDASAFDIDFSLEDWIDDCIEDIETEAETLAALVYAEQLEQFMNGLAESFSSQCFGVGLQEKFAIAYPKREYAFTLYYYDQAGNLVQTVPPQGVHIVPASGFNADGVWLNVEPLHTMKSMYTFNALNQPIKAETPDGGIAQFWYNSAQQARFSQNAVQAATGKYSYSKFDALGRPVEAGVFTGTIATALTYANDNSYPVATSGTPAKDVIRTYYHKQTLTLDAALGWAPKDLNNRVAAAAFYDSCTGINDAYSNALYYNYDIHGNVQQLLTDIPAMGAGQRYKTVDYVYDLYSGKTLEVIYQAEQEDQFLHRYTYDDDNRITGVQTSRDGVEWDTDAAYYYYLHGPMARTELGDYKVQGIDYAYTVHGWLKGVNSNTVTPLRDMGKDGSAQTKANRWVAQDAFGYSLTYYNDHSNQDYKAIVTPAAAETPFAASENAFLPGTGASLYNGNIRAMVTAMRKTDNTLLGTVARVYKYDQLQRIKEAQTWTATNLQANNSWTGAASSTAHYSSYQFDLNGNITRLTRRNSTALLDDLTYTYLGASGGLPNTKNQLANVQDAVATVTTGEISSGQSLGNYTYDAIGRLTSDAQENITSITWNVMNKVTYIARLASSNKPDVAFKYDAMGNRIAKIEYPRSGGVIQTAAIKTTYYALDAQGNVLATYTQTGSSPTSTTLNDFELYGSSRLGTQNVGTALAATPNLAYTSRDNRASAIVELKNTTFANTNLVQYKVGALALNTTQYSWNTGITIQQNAALLMQLINANTVTTDVKASLWYSNNPTGTLYMQLEYTQPGNWQLGALTCYVNSVAASSPGQVPKRAMGYGTAKGNDIVGEKRYVLANHLGNVLEVITDRKTAIDDGVYNLTTGAKTSTTADGFADYYLSTIVAYTDYDPYGTAQEGRKGGITDYRFGFQGQEMDDEIKGEGNSVNYKYRMHDPRLGRFFAVDPLAAKYPHNSPYAFSENVVIHMIEFEGLENTNSATNSGSRPNSVNRGNALPGSNLRPSTQRIGTEDYFSFTPGPGIARTNHFMRPSLNVRPPGTLTPSTGSAMAPTPEVEPELHPVIVITDALENANELMDLYSKKDGTQRVGVQLYAYSQSLGNAFFELSGGVRMILTSYDWNNQQLNFGNAEILNLGYGDKWEFYFELLADKTRFDEAQTLYNQTLNSIIMTKLADLGYIENTTCVPCISQKPVNLDAVPQDVYNRVREMSKTELGPDPDHQLRELILNSSQTEHTSNPVVVPVAQ